MALKATVGVLAPIGLPAELKLELEGVAAHVQPRRCRQRRTRPTKAVVDWASSFPDPDGADDPVTTPVVEGPMPAGLAVATGLDNDPVYIDIDDPISGSPRPR